MKKPGNELLPHPLAARKHGMRTEAIGIDPDSAGAVRALISHVAADSASARFLSM
jgi:hypothetical protein